MATYIPNATLTTEPTEDQTVESAALEFRTLKAYAVTVVTQADDSATAAAASASAAAASAGTATTQAGIATEAAEAAEAAQLDIQTNWNDKLLAADASADAAAASAADALGSETAAASSAADAEAAQVAAEAARDAANAVGNVFSNVTAGIAGTTLGQTFGVLSVDLQDIIFYTNPSTTEVFRLKTKAFFDTVFANGFTAERTGYLYAWVDSAGELLLGIKLDGTLWSKGVNLTDGIADGVEALEQVQAAAPAIAAIQDGPARSDYLTVFLDNASRILGGFAENGELIVKGVNHSQALADVPAVVDISKPITSIAIIGDSLTEGAGSTSGQTVGVQLKALYTAASDNRNVVGVGFGGQAVASILARQGSVPTQITFPVGASGFPEIPASGAAAVTVTNAPLQYADISQAKSMTGSVAGIAGTLTRTANTNNYTFTRSVAGSITPVDSGVPFLPSPAYQNWTFVCWIGTNNLGWDTPANIFAGINSYTGWQNTAQKRRVVVMPTIDCLSGSAATMKTNYATLLALVKAAYPFEYIDTRAILQRNNNGSANDLADIADNLPPRSLLSGDRYHLNNAGYGVIAAEIKRILDLKGF